VTLNDDLTKALPTSHFEVTGDPGLDRFLVVTLAVPYFNWIADYSNIAATAILYLALNNGQTLTTSLFQAVRSGVGSFLANGDVAVTMFANDSYIDPTRGMIAKEDIFPAQVFNSAITLGMFNGANGNLQDGDPANALDLSVLFNVYDRALKRFLTTAESGWNETTRTFS
jgi:hypothetical protein